MIFIISLIPYILQILLIIHVIKTGKPFYWLYLMIFLPYIGGIAYLVVEILPEYFNSHARQKMSANLVTIINPNAKIEQLEKQLQQQNTIANKLVLAEAYANAEKYVEAINLYKECLTGPYQDDRTILFPLAKSYYFLEKYDAAKEILTKLKSESPLADTSELLIDYLTEDKLGIDSTEKLQRLYEKSRNFEVGYFYITKLIQSNQKEQAKQIVTNMKEIVKTYKNFSHTMGKEWIQRSEAELNKN